MELRLIFWGDVSGGVRGTFTFYTVDNHSDKTANEWEKLNRELDNSFSEVKMFYTYGTQQMIDQELKAARNVAQTYNLIEMARMHEQKRSTGLLFTISSLARSVMHRFEGPKSSKSVEQVEYTSTC